MRPVLRALAIVVLLAAWARSLAAAPRTWTDVTGRFRIEAELVGVSGRNVLLRETSGRTRAVPIDRLSPADQTFVRQWQAGRPPATGVPPTPPQPPIAPAQPAPLDAMVRIVAPVVAANGQRQEVSTVGCAIRLDGHPAPVVLGSRLAIRYGLEPQIIDAGLARAEFLDLRRPTRLGTAARLGFPRPVGPNLSGSEDLVIVLPAGPPLRMHALPLAPRDPARGETVLLPLLPPPQREPTPERERPAIAWTRWTVDEARRGRLYVQPQDGQFPSTGAVPIVTPDYRVAGLYFTKTTTADGQRVVGDGVTASVLRAALQKVQIASPSNSSGSSVARPVRFPPIAEGPVDPRAAWRSRYEEFLRAIAVRPAAGGQSRFDWGAAADFGAWYERRRYIAMLTLQAAQNPAQRPRVLAAVASIEHDAERAAQRLQGITWTAVARQISPEPHASCQFDLAPLPAPLRASFWVEEGDAEAWRAVERGDRVRFRCRFVVRSLGNDPPIDVLMTLLEVRKP